MTLEKWQNLLSTLELTDGDETEILNRSALKRFESEYCMVLPGEYKHFCEVFGTGILGNFIRIYCPSRSLIDSQDIVSGMIEQLNRYPSSNAERDQNYLELLRTSFRFGDDAWGSAIIFWDLRSYSEVDDSYDIYYAAWEMPETDNAIFICRNFFDFVQNFCFGTKAYEILPDPEISCPAEIPSTFYRFHPEDWNSNYQSPH